MKRIICTFYRPEKVNTREFSNIVGKMEGDLYTICSAKDLREREVLNYVNDLLRNAKPLERNPEMYFLGLDEPHKMPSDARVDFFYRPTYIGTAFIIKSILSYPKLMDDRMEISEEINQDLRTGIKTVFPGLLKGCTGRGFGGHGYDALKGLIETLQIFAEAGTMEFIEKYPDICPEFNEKFRKAVDHIEELVKADKAEDAWGTKYTKEAEELLQAMYKK